MARRLSGMAARVAKKGGVIVQEKDLWWPYNFALCQKILNREGEPMPRQTTAEGHPIFVARSEAEALELYLKSLGGRRPANETMVQIARNQLVEADKYPGKFQTIRMVRKAYQWAAEEPIGPLREGTGWAV